MNAKKRPWKKVLASIAVSGVVLSGVVLGSSASSSTPLVIDASAGVAGGGSSGGGGGSGGTNGAYWVEISKAKLESGRVSKVPADFRNDPVCRNAQKYYGLVGTFITGDKINGGWSYGLWGVQGLNTSGAPGGANVASAIAANVGWSQQQAAAYMYQKNLICLDNPNVVVNSEWRYEVRSSSDMSASLDVEGIVGFTTTVSPQPINKAPAGPPSDFQSDPVGEKNLNAQSVRVETKFGEVYRQFNAALAAQGASNGNIAAKYKPLLEQAKQADKTTTAHATVELNSGNQAGMAEGGILNVSENSQTGRATASTTTTPFHVWRCGYVQYSKTGWQPHTKFNCLSVSGSINPDALPTDGLASARWLSQGERNEYRPTVAGQTSWREYATRGSGQLRVQAQLGFWQMISAHCNEPGFAALLSTPGLGLTAMDNAPDRGISGLMRTKFYAQQPTVLPLGSNHSSLPAAQRATSMLGFFDKECPFDCTPSKAATDGASDANGATTNVADGGFSKTVKGLYGASSGDSVNSSYAEIFRDNAPRTIRPDVWYPVSGRNGVSYDGAAAKSTLITRWAGGTPVLGSEFNAYSVKGDSRELIFDPKARQMPQKNFDSAEPFRSPTAGQAIGLIDSIEVQSTWASKASKPQALQIAWEYSPTVRSRVATGIGFGPGGTSVQVGSYIEVATKVDGRCWGNYGTATQAPSEKTLAKADLSANTGTGGLAKFSAPDGELKNTRNIVLNFIRGTSE